MNRLAGSARVVELADTPDLGSGAAGIRVQVPSLARIMIIKSSYLVTVLVSVLLVFAGHKIAMNGLFSSGQVSHEVARAKIQSVTGRITPVDDSGGLIPMQGDSIVFEAKITGGPRKGEIVSASQNLGGFAGVSTKEVAKGDTVLLTNFNNEWYFNGYFRTSKLLVLGLLFVLSVLIFGGRKGFNTILSLGLTCASIFAILIPAILSGKNIYTMSILVCVYTIAMTLLIVIGFNKKSLAAAVGCASGVTVAGIITVIMDKVLVLSGIVDEHSRYLAGLPLENQINLRAIIFAGIIIGAMGAVMDVAISIASSLWELKEKAAAINFKSLFRSGLNIGRDILGTMANTLVLAYIGSSLSVVLILSVYSNSLLSLLNSEMIVVEILKTLAGTLGILSAMPLTALFCSFFYLKKDKDI